MLVFLFHFLMLSFRISAVGLQDLCCCTSLYCITGCCIVCRCITGCCIVCRCIARRCIVNRCNVYRSISVVVRIACSVLFVKTPEKRKWAVVCHFAKATYICRNNLCFTHVSKLLSHMAYLQVVVGSYGLFTGRLHPYVREEKTQILLFSLILPCGWLFGAVSLSSASTGKIKNAALMDAHHQLFFSKSQPGRDSAEFLQKQ